MSSDLAFAVVVTGGLALIVLLPLALLLWIANDTIDGRLEGAVGDGPDDSTCALIGIVLACVVVAVLWHELGG